MNQLIYKEANLKCISSITSSVLIFFDELDKLFGESLLLSSGFKITVEDVAEYFKVKLGKEGMPDWFGGTKVANE